MQTLLRGVGAVVRIIGIFNCLSAVMAVSSVNFGRMWRFVDLRFAVFATFLDPIVGRDNLATGSCLCLSTKDIPFRFVAPFAGYGDVTTASAAIQSIRARRIPPDCPDPLSGTAHPARTG